VLCKTSFHLNPFRCVAADRLCGAVVRSTMCDFFIRRFIHFFTLFSLLALSFLSLPRKHENAKIRHDMGPSAQTLDMCRARKARSLRELSVPHLQWVHRLQNLQKTFKHPRNQGPYWTPLLTKHEHCEWLNTILRKLWPIYDAPVCT
jgi:hypothetical protein